MKEQLLTSTAGPQEEQDVGQFQTDNCPDVVLLHFHVTTTTAELIQKHRSADLLMRVIGGSEPFVLRLKAAALWFRLTGDGLLNNQSAVFVFQRRLSGH